MTKITLATIKSFIRKNQGKLYINVQSTFDGMVDCVMPTVGGFEPIKPSSLGQEKYTLGIAGAWFVGGSRNIFTAYEEGEFKGYEVYNCCGSFILAIK